MRLQNFCKKELLRRARKKLDANFVELFFADVLQSNVNLSVVEKLRLHFKN
ncbi:hypothetical protein [Synergistes jonesii]|uniref:hypothetical protein n=1 Tax=Synergistes jonesii TaxID=2754 RepID=UPI00159F174E|nr:hypothetical protein [Synergistes jonesii]